ncbi:nuclear transport factor 2 family protein [Pedobacter petrophilus]|uniref:Nuclear transport factor 2 family protein n=1 Tax=Pedobacter petrophilus TaxID=1908241 RepID=A0A7K0G411_9SPHI|nr:nuclear transport factor 2 family protein [Pedobacter petrophilus]MRX78134.1 nuclear transport factor 2 family protein [Pedobacter petrophilus]
MKTENSELINTYFDLFNKHEWEKMADLYTEEAEIKDPSVGQQVVKQSKQEIIQRYSEMQQMFPNLKNELVQVYPSGESHVIVEFVSSGTAADGSDFTLPICVIFTIENGKITKDFSYYDNFDS